MNHQAPNPSVEVLNADDHGTPVTLRIVGGNGTGAVPEESRCLLYLVPLDRKAAPYPLTRRLRLKDNLAGGSARRNAGILARDPGFWHYLQLISLTAYEQEIDSHRARHFINRVCGIQGRQELDRTESAAARFFRLIEQPFLEWLLADCRKPDLL